MRQKISDDVNTVLTSSVSKRIAHTGQIVNPGSSIDFEKSIDEQRAEFAKLAAILGLRIPSPK